MLILMQRGGSAAVPLSEDTVTKLKVRITCHLTHVTRGGNSQPHTGWKQWLARVNFLFVSTTAMSLSCSEVQFEGTFSNKVHLSVLLWFIETSFFSIIFLMLMLITVPVSAWLLALSAWLLQSVRGYCSPCVATAS